MANSGGSKGGGAAIPLKGRYNVYPDSPLPAYDSLPALAYRAEHMRDKNRNLFAYVCDPKMPPRLDVIGSLHRVDHRSFMRVVDWDIIDWHPEGRRCPVLICEKPRGERVIPSLDASVAPVSEEVLIRGFITPITSVLRDIHNQGVFHGNIRPDNVYYDGDEDEDLVLGECFAAPSMVTLPTAFCTIEASLCAPGGRGYGSAEEDLYALGMTLLSFVIGKNPASKFETEEEMLQTRLSYGTYGAMAQSYRISLTLMEPLRGLLNDNVDDRWTLNDLSMWVDGRRLSPKQQVMPNKASRVFKFNGGEYGTAREVAYGLSRNWDMAMGAVTDGSLDNWLRRSLSEEEVIEAVNMAKNVSASNPEEEDRMIGRVLISLCPERPVQLRDFSSSIDGLGQLLGLHAKEPDARKLFSQLMSASLVPYWLEMQSKNKPEHLRIMAKLEKSKVLIRKNILGSGVERLVYELNLGFPCMSPLLDRDYVPNIDYLLPALDRLAAQRGDKVESYIDMDIAAFVTVHFKRSVSDELKEITDQENDFLPRVAELKMLAKLQEALAKKMELHGLCGAMVKQLAPAIERFHSRKTRTKVEEKLKKAAKTGKLVDMLVVIDDKDELKTDHASFQQAAVEYAQSVIELVQQYRDDRNRTKIAGEIGGQISSALSGILATGVAVIIFAFQLI